MYGGKSFVQYDLDYRPILRLYYAIDSESSVNRGLFFVPSNIKVELNMRVPGLIPMERERFRFEITRGTKLSECQSISPMLVFALFVIAA